MQWITESTRICRINLLGHVLLPNISDIDKEKKHSKIQEFNMHILARPIIYVSLHTVQKLFPRAMILLISRANRDFVSKIHLMTHPRRCQVHKARSVYRERDTFFAAQKLIYFSCSFFFLLFFVNHFFHFPIDRSTNQTTSWSKGKSRRPFQNRTRIPSTVHWKRQAFWRVIRTNNSTNH